MKPNVAINFQPGGKFLAHRSQFAALGNKADTPKS